MGKGNGKEGVLVVSNENHRATQMRTKIRNWLAKQRKPVDAAICTAMGVIVGGTTSYSGDIIYSALFLSCGVPEVQSLPIRVPTTLPICKMAIIGGAYAGITRALKRLKGREDVLTNLAVGFGLGAMGSLVAGIKGTNAIIYCIFFALVNVGIAKITDKIFQHQDS